MDSTVNENREVNVEAEAAEQTNAPDNTETLNGAENVAEQEAAAETENAENQQPAPEPEKDTRDFELRFTDEELAKKKKLLAIWDKVTTGILIALMCAPFAILAYIFIWFLTK